MGHWLGHLYRDRIVDDGREPLFLLLLGLLGSFLFIRFSVRMIRRQVSWWPGNVSPGGTHIHHVVFGQAFLMIAGVGVFAVRDGGRTTYDVLAVVFGIGCGLVLDEFALVLHLEDVYWKEEGRQSVDAVILVVAVVGLLLVGQVPLGGYVGGTSYESYLVAAALLGFVVLCLMKGKVWTGLLGVMVPVFAVVGALRLARPGSPWARWRYGARPRRMARAERREHRIHRRVAVAKTAVMDAVAGAPSVPRSAPAVAPAPGPTIVDLPPSRLELLLARVLRPLPEPGAAVAVWYLRVVGALDLVTALVPAFRHAVRAAGGGQYISAFLVGPGFTGAALAFALSVSLRRRKRAAWILTVVLVAVYAVGTGLSLVSVSAARGHPGNWVFWSVTVLLLGALLVSRPLFNVRGERGNASLGLLSLLIGAVVAVGVGTLIVRATDRVPPAQWGRSAQYASVRVLTVSGVFSLPGVRVPGWTDLTINLLSVALLLVVVLAFLRSPRGRARLTPADEERLRGLLRAAGGGGPAAAERAARAGPAAPAGPAGPVDPPDSLGYFALRRDHAVCWSADGRVAVSYRVTNGVALATGDPLGPRTAWPDAIADWLTLTRRHAWVAAVAHAGPAGTVAYESAGLLAVSAGEEAVVDPAVFAAALGDTGGGTGQDRERPEGSTRLGPAPHRADRSGADLAGARHAMKRAGYQVAVRRAADVPAGEWPRLTALAAAWRRSRGGVELGRIGDGADGACVIAECRDPGGRTCAVLAFVPWGADGLTLDLVRRDRESGRGPVDLLLTEVLLRAAAGTPPLAGIVRVSLNLLRWPLTAYAPRRQARQLLVERRAEIPRVMTAGLLAERRRPRRLLPR
ncbi:phosphatidylglycerol lysyltransferase domain-containing protein [Streptomyces sp. NBC_01190]|uniref:phosphatidylglycerol lysyltransferase domain-containing protein n=1 Tax=Streptomyces sp. NBC_01190 TaxID=2903767 RepID=UPI0038668589|nr:phosphatidylglycerol lysyltransferase domain-containing protein [Streptomyces sp. NBC_01190]